MAACYRLARSVLKLGSAVLEELDRGMWVDVTLQVAAHGGCCNWLQKKHLVGHFSTLLHKHSFLLHFWHSRQLSV